MSRIKNTLSHWGAFDQRSWTDQEIEDELQFHLEMRMRDNMESGLAPEQARTEALRRFGDFERVRNECYEINQERLAGQLHLKAIKGFIWVMFGVGLTLCLASSIKSVHQVGQVLIWIAVLWRLLLYLRAMSPVRHYVPPSDNGLLVLAEPPIAESRNSIDLSEVKSGQGIPARDQDGRTPVERLLANDE